MEKQQASEAVIFTFRLNPRSSDFERAAMQHLVTAKEHGYNTKGAIVDALCARAGHAPEMFTGAQANADTNGVSLEQVQALLETLERNLRSEFASGALTVQEFTEQPAAQSKRASKLLSGIGGRQAATYENVDDEA